MNQYTTKKGQQGDVVLEVNGMQSICPYVQAIQVQGSMGQIQIMRLPCTNTCPHVEINDSKWIISCSGEKRNIPLTAEVVEETPKSPFSIV
jgi:hypothetical protein